MSSHHHPDFTTKIVECLGLLDAEHPERITVKGLPLERTDHERFCESMAYSRECCSVEISTSARALRNLAYALLFILPRRIELSTCQVASVKETAQNDQSTHFEMTCQTSKCVGQRLVRL